MKQVQRFLVLLLCLGSAAIGQKAEPPVQVLNVVHAAALDGFPDRGYYILTSDGNVLRYAPGKQSKLQFQNQFSLPQKSIPFDITYSLYKQQESAIVTTWVDTIRFGFIYRFAPDGTVLHYWTTRQRPAGIDYNEKDHSIYFVTSDSNEIYRIDLDESEAKYICDVPGAKLLGPLALDTAANVAYVGDIETGNIFAVDLVSHKTKEAWPAVGAPSAFRLDATNRVLYIADTARSKILAVSLKTPNQDPQIVFQSSKIHYPSGIAPWTGSSLLVTDYTAGAVFAIHPQMGVLDQNTDQTHH
jgi:DNA-binding beta-propeller fold protein YncE